MRQILIITSAVALVAGCLATQTRTITKGVSDPGRMVALIEDRVPLGAPVEDAERFMRSEGFTCTRVIHGDWGERRGLDYPYCDRSEQAGGWVDRRWQIAVFQRDEKVTEVLANTGLVGP
jgi:hypothetical protein